MLSPSAEACTAEKCIFTREMRNHDASSVLIGNYLYGFSSTILTAMRFDNGQVAWKDRSVGKGSDSLTIGCTCSARTASSDSPRLRPEAYREHGRFHLKTGNLPICAHPVVSGGTLFLRDRNTIYAYNVRGSGRLRGKLLSPIFLSAWPPERP